MHFQFCKIWLSKLWVRLSKQCINVVLTVKYTAKADCLPGQAAIDSNRKLSSASITQLHKTVPLIKTYRWLGILTGMLLSLQIKHLLFGQFANTISCPQS